MHFALWLCPVLVPCTLMQSRSRRRRCPFLLVLAHKSLAWNQSHRGKPAVVSVAHDGGFVSFARRWLEAMNRYLAQSESRAGKGAVRIGADAGSWQPASGPPPLEISPWRRSRTRKKSNRNARRRRRFAGSLGRHHAETITYGPGLWTRSDTCTMSRKYSRTRRLKQGSHLL